MQWSLDRQALHVQMSSARWDAGTPKNLEPKQLSQIISRHRNGKNKKQKKNNTK